MGVKVSKMPSANCLKALNSITNNREANSSA